MKVHLAVETGPSPAAMNMKMACGKVLWMGRGDITTDHAQVTRSLCRTTKAHRLRRTANKQHEERDNGK